MVEGGKVWHFFTEPHMEKNVEDIVRAWLRCCRNSGLFLLTHVRRYYRGQEFKLMRIVHYLQYSTLSTAVDISWKHKSSEDYNF